MKNPERFPDCYSIDNVLPMQSVQLMTLLTRPLLGGGGGIVQLGLEKPQLAQNLEPPAKIIKPHSV